MILNWDLHDFQDDPYSSESEILRLKYILNAKKCLNVKTLFVLGDQW